MTSKRLFFVLLAMIVLIAGGAIGGVVMGQKLLQQKTHELVELKAESQALQTRQASLAKAKKDIEKYQPFEKIAKSVVPQEKDQARTIRELVKIANDSGIKLGALSFPASTLGAAPAAKKPATGDTTTAKKTAPIATTQVEPVTGISGLSQMKINVQSAGTVPYQSLLLFLSKLEQNRRTSQVGSLTVQPDTVNRNIVTFNLVLNVYIKQ